MLITIGTVFVSIAAVAFGLSDFGPLFHASMIAAGAVYLVTAVLGVNLALQMDERRKVAAVWLRAFEEKLR